MGLSLVPVLNFLDRCIFTATSGGAGSFVFSAPVTGFQSPATAGVTNSFMYGYAAQLNDLSQWEYGYGTWNAGVLTRTVLGNSNANTSPVNFTSAPNVEITLLAETMQQIINTAKITAQSNVSLFVAPPPLGNDLNMGTSSLSPFATIQKAATAAAQYDYINLYFPQIFVADGTYSPASNILLPSLTNCLQTNFPSGGLIQGDPTIPENCIITGAGIQHGASGTAWSLTGFMIQNNPSGTAINVSNGAAILNIDSLHFKNNLRHIQAASGANIFSGFDNFKLAFESNAHELMRCNVASLIADFGSTWTFVGSQTYSNTLFLCANSAVLDANFNVAVNPGNAHGVRYKITDGGIFQEIHFADRSQFLGDTVGVIDTFHGSVIDNDPIYNIYTPTNGSTVTTTPGEPRSILEPTGNLSTLTVNPPTNMSDGETWHLSSSHTITTLTLTTTDGSSIVGAPSTIAAGSGFTLLFDTAANTWNITV